MSADTGVDTLSAIAGTTRYEFRMQIRRRAVWIVMGLFVLWALIQFRLVFFQGPAVGLPLAEVVAGWALILQAIVPVAYGILLADRLPRDRNTRVSELFETLPASPGGLLLGKYLGSTLATLVPLFLTYVGVMIYVAIDRGELAAVPLGLLAFAGINVPGLLFVAAFSIACPVLLWVPLYQFLFVGYWLWGNLLNPEGPIPTIAGTLLNPIGEYMANGFFGATGLYVRDAAPWEGLVSMLLLLDLAALALLSAHRYLRWRRARQ